jgi:hypothetical protein
MSVCQEALAYCVATQTPVLSWGQPGTAKTSVAELIAAILERYLETVIASIRDPSDFGGLPLLSKDEKGMYFLAPPNWARNLAKHKNPILFLDEISTAPPAVQAALLRVVLDKVVGDLALPAGTSIIAAANPPDEAAGGWELAAPLANRFCHIDWTLEVSAWADGLAMGKWDPPVVPILPKGWRDAHVPTARAMVASFVKKNPALMLALPKEESEQGRAWPSPRSWTMAAELLAAVHATKGSNAVRNVLVNGCIGEGAGKEFTTWLGQMDLPDPEALLANPMGIDLPTDRGDKAFVVCTAVAAAATKNSNVDRWNASWKVLKRFADAGLRDTAAVAAKTLCLHIPPNAPAPVEAGVFAEVLKKAGLLKDRS